MNRRKQVLKLGWGDFVVPDETKNTEIAGARITLVEMTSRVFPRLFERLCTQVYPNFARFADKRPDYWKSGWTFEAWQQQSDSDPQLTQSLLGWAKAFHAEESWILEGAWQTLWLWHREPELRKSLDTTGFRSACAVDTLSSDEEKFFNFEHDGWDPQFQSWPDFRRSLEHEFQIYLETYRNRLSSLMESRGAVRVRNRYTLDHLKWFVLFQLAGLPASKVLERLADNKHDVSTVLKGVKTAAALLQWRTLRQHRSNPKSSRTKILT